MFDGVVIVLYSLSVIISAYLFLKFVDRVQRRRRQRDYERLKREQPERVYGTAEYHARFDHPDIAAIEAHIQRPLPSVLKQLYSDSATMRTENFSVMPPDPTTPEAGHRVGCFFPADARAITDLWADEYLEPHQIPFATDGDCGLYYAELQVDDQNDPAVYADHHGRDCPIKIAESLGEFLSWRRVASNG